MKSENKLTDAFTTKKDGTREFPDSYYEHHEQGITRKMVDEVLVKQHKKLLKKVRDSVSYNLKNRPTTDLAKDILSDAIAPTLERFDKNLLLFHTQNKFVGYLLITAWREYRRQQKKLVKLKRNEYDEADFGFSERIQVSLDAVAELSNPAPEYMESELFKSDSHVEFLYERLWGYLDDSVLDGEFTLREATIFKLYIVNEYSIARMAEQTSFSRTSIVSALSKIKQHLATVDFRLEQYTPPVQERYNDDPFDFEL